MTHCVTTAVYHIPNSIAILFSALHKGVTYNVV